ncbi:MAG TPA: hypothetical protein VKA43_06175 [Gammaproteobacteria bacterium]|nr:hypothetical protein [Gammaproteobacteria bacterium]
MRRAFRWSLLLVVLLGALSVVLLAATVYTYDRLTAETLIAELRFDETGDRQYVAHLRTGDRCDERTYPVFGDQWRVDAEFLKWKYWAMLLGLDSQYRLDRLEGRYRSAAEQNTAPNVAHDLAERTAVDVVAVAGALGSLNFLLDATYGSSTYEDIDVGNVYYVFRTTTGIITRHEPRPLAPPAGEALSVTIDGACGEPSLPRRLVGWADDGALAVLDLTGF